MSETKLLFSTLDKSINRIDPVADGGYFETRYVQRTEDTAIVYLSSASGCNKACRFCHLTQTGQLYTTDVNKTEYRDTARALLEEASRKNDFSTVQNIHFNFMARGDVLSNMSFTTNVKGVLASLARVAKDFFPAATPRFKLSTVFPTDINNGHMVSARNPAEYLQEALVDPVFNLRHEQGIDVEFYYSLYSLRPEFRKRWIPKAFDPSIIGKAFEGFSEGFRIHHALIAGENDTEEDVALIHNWLEEHDIRAQFNIVRYNPFDNHCGSESDDVTMKTYIDMLKLSHRVVDVYVIPRVGKDVQASCGLFYSGK